jgi:hypothetical protein
MRFLLAERLALAGGIDRAVPNLKVNARQRALRWASQWTTRRQVKISLMAGTVELLVFGFGNNRAEQMCTKPVIGDEIILIESHDNTRVILGRIGEDVVPPNRDALYLTNRHQW